MSRTRRKSYLVVTTSKETYIKDSLRYHHTRTSYEYVLDESGTVAYKKAMEEYEKAHDQWRNQNLKCRKPVSNTCKKVWYMFDEPEEPMLRDYRKLVRKPVEFDYEKEVVEISDDYAKSGRDNRYSDSTSRNKDFKDYCKRDMRSKTKRLENKIMKDDDVWESEVFPHDCQGKKYIWSVW